MDKEKAKEIVKRHENYSKVGSVFTTHMLREVEKARECIKENNQ